jgi:hypothetical protein
MIAYRRPRTYGCIAIGFLMLATVDVVAADLSRLRDCELWQGGGILEDGQDLTIRAVAAVRSTDSFRGSDTQRGEHLVVFPLQVRERSPGIAYVALLDIGTSGPYRFLTRVSRPARLLLPSPFGPAGPPSQKEIDSGFLHDYGSMVPQVFEPLGCRQVSAGQPLIAVAAKSVDAAERISERTSPTPEALSGESVPPTAPSSPENAASSLAKTTGKPSPPEDSDADVDAGLTSLRERYGSMPEAGGSLKKLALARTEGVGGGNPAAGSLLGLVPGAAELAGQGEGTAEADAARLNLSGPEMPVGASVGEAPHVASAGKACTERLAEVTLEDGAVLGPLMIGGIRNAMPTATAYWFDASIDEVLQLPTRVDLGASRGRLVPLQLAGAEQHEVAGEAGSALVPVRFASLDTAPRLPATEPKLTDGRDAIKVLVVGDAASVAVAGLADVESALRAKRPGFSWTIEWRAVAEDGSLAVPEPLPSFAALEVRAHQVAEAVPTSVYLDRDETFTRFIQEMQSAIVGAPEPVDFVLWVKEGYAVPLSAPMQLQALIAAVHSDGPIPRFPNGQPRKWLHVISGSMPGASRSLIAEPIARSEPVPGYVEEEGKIASPRRLLQRLDPVVLSLEGAGRWKVAPEADGAADEIGEFLHVSASDAFEAIVLIVAIPELESIRKAVADLYGRLTGIKAGAPLEQAFSTPNADLHYDASFLLRPQSDAVGNVRGAEADDTGARALHRVSEIGVDNAETLLARFLANYATIDLPRDGSDGCSHIVFALGAIEIADPAGGAP